jgi:hypothetical protein
MSVFNLHADVLANYRDFERSFIAASDDRAQDYVERARGANGRR